MSLWHSILVVTSLDVAGAKLNNEEELNSVVSNLAYYVEGCLAITHVRVLVYARSIRGA